MEILCTRPGCTRPLNNFADLDNPANLKTVQQKYCLNCGMPLILAGRYLPVKLLGEGGFGRAFLACDRYTPTLRPCTVKQFQPAGNLSPQELAVAQDLFEREAVVLEQLGNKHPQIPDLYAFFPLIVPDRSRSKEDCFFYLVQEFIEGQDLEKELAAKGKFNEAEVLAVLEEMLEILQFVHNKGSIHRDIKPSNIMRDAGGRLYLLDFGAVKQVAAGGTPQARSTGVYSMGFAPPEQMAGSQVYPATDLYALAATCLNLLTGKSSEELYDAYNNRWNWRSHAPQVSDRLAAILDRLLLPAPKDRYQSAHEVLAALHPPAAAPRTAIQAPAQSRTPASPPRRPTSSFSLREILTGAAFTGFEGSLVAITFHSLLAAPGVILGLMTMAGLVFLQSRRIIEGKDLPIIAGITVLVLWLVPFLHGGYVMPQVLIFATLTSTAAIAVTALFRLIYQLLSRF